MNLKIIKMIKTLNRFKKSQDQGRLWPIGEETTRTRQNMVATLEVGWSGIPGITKDGEQDEGIRETAQQDKDPAQWDKATVGIIYYQLYI